MNDFLLNTSLITGIVIFVIITVFFGLIVYLASNRMVRNHLKKEHGQVGRVLFRVGASLLAFLLSITFANQRVDYFSVKSSLEAEAAKLVGLYMNLELYNTPESKSIQSKIQNYIITVSEEGWKSLEKDPFKSNTAILFKDIYSDIYSLEAPTPFHAKLLTNMVSDVKMMSDYLQVRFYSSRSESNFLLYTTVFGLIVIMILFSVYEPNRLTLVFLGLYVSFIGIVLYFIMMMNNPLQGPLQIEGEPFLLLKETIESRI